MDRAVGANRDISDSIDIGRCGWRAADPISTGLMTKVLTMTLLVTTQSKEITRQMAIVHSNMCGYADLNDQRQWAPLVRIMGEYN